VVERLRARLLRLGVRGRGRHVIAAATSHRWRFERRCNGTPPYAAATPLETRGSGVGANLGAKLRRRARAAPLVAPHADERSIRASRWCTARCAAGRSSARHCGSSTAAPLTVDNCERTSPCCGAHTCTTTTCVKLTIVTLMARPPLPRRVGARLPHRRIHRYPAKRSTVAIGLGSL
jgi:hypothetical protein